MSYKLKDNGYVLRITDGAWIPPDPANADWRDYQDWLAAGNIPEPEDPRSPPPPAPPDRLAILIDELIKAGTLTRARADTILGK